MKTIFKKIGKNTLMIIGGILVVLGTLGIFGAITIAAYELHWFLGSIVGCFFMIVIGLFLMNVIENEF